MGILFLRPGQALIRHEHGAIDCYGQAAMPASQHQYTEHELASCVPGAAKAVGVPRHSRADANRAVSGNHLEDNVEGGEYDRVACELALFDRLDHEDR